jgi:hypothetical protein
MKKNLLVLLLLALGSQAYANDAGCGLGSLVIQRNTKLMQLFAITTNGTFGSQTFGITSGTSNCSSSGIVMNDKQIQYFVEANQDDITREMAQGHGEKLSTLAALHGCSTDKSVAGFSSAAQTHFEEIVPSAKVNAVDMVRNMKATSIADVCSGS